MRTIRYFYVMYTVYFETFGCQMNVADSNMIADILAEKGYAATEFVRDADLIIVNTCSVRERAELRAMSRIEEYGNLKKNGAKLWVIGCMAQRIGNDLIKRNSKIDKVIGAKSIDKISQHIDEYLLKLQYSSSFNTPHQGAISRFIPVMRGCNNFCTYCIVPYVRGREHSIPMKQLKQNIRNMCATGTKEITLLGQNVNSYKDGKFDFSDLIMEIHDIPELLRIRFTTSHPKDISNKLIETIANFPKVSRHIHLPVQSGSTRILSAMNRNYTREHYLEKIYAIKQMIPDVDLTTDVMVGFPDEQEKDFEDTLSLFREVQYTTAFMFLYSIREGTKAATMDKQIPLEVKKARLQHLIKMQTDITKRKYQEMIGTTVEVLFTYRQQKKDYACLGQDTGCKRVLVNCKKDLTSKILSLQVKNSTGMTLICEEVKDEIS